MSATRHINNLLTVGLFAALLLNAPSADARKRTPSAKPTASTATFSAAAASDVAGDEDDSSKPKTAEEKAEAARADEEAAAEVLEKKAKTSVGVPLSQRIRAVTSQTFMHQRRFLVGPKIGTTINDPFYANFAVGLNAGYYVTEHLLIGLSGDFVAANGPSNLVKVVGRAEGKEAAKYYAPMYAAYVDVNWIPFYGKMSFMAEGVLHYDFYLLGGLGISGMRSKDPDVDFPPLSFSGQVGIGAHLILNNWVALRFELADNISYGSRYIGDVPGKEEAGLQNIITFSVGADFFFPRSNR